MDSSNRPFFSKPMEPNPTPSSHLDGLNPSVSRRDVLTLLGAASSVTLLPGLSAALLSALTGCRTPQPRLLAPALELDEPPLGRSPFDLAEVAAEFVRLAETSRPGHGEPSRLWGRIGGSRAEADAAILLESRLRPWVNALTREDFPFEAARPDGWSVTISGATALASAVPAPVSARFPDGARSAPLHAVRKDADWELTPGRWVYLPPRPGDTLRRNPARETEAYVRAVKAGAAGVIFALPTPPGTWRCAIEADADGPGMQELFGTPFHPIPCFCVDAEDGGRIEEAARSAADLQARIVYEPLTRRNGANVVALLRAGGAASGDSSRLAAEGVPGLSSRRAASGPIAFFAHLDGYFSGATDNASGLATLVGLAQQLALGPRLARRCDVYFVGLSAQHDDGAGLRAFAAADPARFASIRQFYFLRRTDAAAGEGPGSQGGEDTAPIAFLGDTSWDGLGEVLPEISTEAAFPGSAPQIARRLAGIAALADLRPGRARVFCLDRLPPYAFTDHDTLDKVSGGGLAGSVEFHLRVIETAGALVPGTYRSALRPAPAPRA